MTKKNVLTVIMAVVLTVIATVTIGSVYVQRNLYADSGIITQIDKGDDEDKVVIEMQNGNEFAFTIDSGADDYETGDIVSAIFSKGGKKNDVRDDKIIYTRYSGYVSETETASWVK